jgi:hypothetical protein
MRRQAAKMKHQNLILVPLIFLFAAPAVAQRKNCDELKAEITAKLDAKNVKNYTLEIVPAETVKDEKVVGSCDGGTKRILYKRTSQ